MLVSQSKVRQVMMVWGGGVVSAEERGRMCVNGFRRQLPRGRWCLEQDSESMLTPLPVNDLLTHTRKKSEDSQGQGGRVWRAWL